MTSLLLIRKRKAQLLVSDNSCQNCWQYPMSFAIVPVTILQQLSAQPRRGRTRSRCRQRPLQIGNQ
jgi:hypothetical protein